MIISILNCDIHFGIGRKNGLLFSLPLDMKYFREATKGHVVAMGKNTLLSFPGCKPLKNRTNIVLTNNVDDDFEGTTTIHSFEEFINLIKELGKTQTVFIIGGASIYAQTLPYVDEVYLTKVNADGNAEVFFPNLDENKNFECYDEGEPIFDNGFEIRFTKYRNLNRLD